jgi:lysozyme
VGKVTHSPACTTLTASFESFRPTAYQDGNGVWTLGYGRAIGITEGMTCTLAQAQEWLSEDLGVADAALTRLVKVGLNQNQWDAICDFVFNIGQGHFAGSSCLAMLNQGDGAGAIRSICYLGDDEKYHGWVIVAGEASPGLVRRRQAEQALFDQEAV